MKRIILLITLITAGILLKAQPGLKPGTGLIVGQVVDDQDKPLPYTTVLVYDSRDSLVNGYLTDTTGYFVIKDLPFGKYSVEVKFVGFKAKKITGIELSKKQRFVQVGKIKIVPDDQQIEAVTVTGTATGNVVYKLDKKVIYPSKDIQSTGGSAVEVLRTAPGVQVDYQGNVSLRGSSSFKVLINGKPTALDGNEALKQIPASSIQKIEIITNPSAKYDPDGVAGIINIITKAKGDHGLSGKIELGADNFGSKNADLIIRYRNNKFEVVAQATYMDKINEFKFFQNRTTKLDSLDFVLASNGLMKNFYGTMTGKFSVNYFPDDKNTFTLNLQYGQKRFGNNFNTNSYTALGNMATIYYLQTSSFDYRGNLAEGDFNYEHKFSDKQKLTAYVQYSDYVPQKINLLRQDTTDANWNIISPYAYQQRTVETIRERKIRAQADYEQPIGQKGKLETGLTFRHLTNPDKYDYFLYDYGINDWQLYPDRSSNTEFNRNIYAGYITVGLPNNFVDFKLGLRAEYTDRAISDLSGNTYAYRHLDFFPTVHLSKSLPHNQQIQLSYSRRVQRPSTFHLNPTPIVVDKYTVQVGNPDLKPEFTNSFELSYLNKFGMNSITLEAYVRQSTGKFSQIQQPQGQLMRMTWANIDRETFAGASLSGNFVLFKMFMLNTSVDGYYDQLTSTLDGNDINKSTFTWQGRTFLITMLPTGTMLQLGGMYMGRELSIQGERKPLFLTFAGVRQNLMKNKLTLSFTAVSPFMHPKFTMVNSDQNFTSELGIEFYKPMLMFDITFRLRNFKEDFRRKQADQDQEQTVPFMGQGIY